MKTGRSIRRLGKRDGLDFLAGAREQDLPRVCESAIVRGIIQGVNVTKQQRAHPTGKGAAPNPIIPFGMKAAEELPAFCPAFA